MKRISHKRKKVELSGKRCFVGVDVHKLTYYVALLSEEGLRQEFSTPAEPQRLLLQLKNMGIEILSLAHESGPTGFGLAWACQEAGVPIVVAAASKIPRPVLACGKNDRLDAMKLVDYLSRGLLQSVSIPTPQEYALREVERRRQRLCRRRAKVRQGIKSFLLRNSLSDRIRLKSWSKLETEALERLELEDEFLQMTLLSFLAEHGLILAEIQKLTKRLSEGVRREGKQEMIRNLQSIPGVGETVAHSFVAEIFRPERFERAEELSAYVGLAPIISQSGQGRGRAHLRPVGQKYLRGLLVEAAWVSIRYDKNLRDFYGRLLSRTNMPSKAITGVARKLLTVIWRVAVEKRPYKAAA